MSLSLDEVCASGGDMEFRFRFWSERDTTYEISWFEVKKFPDGTRRSEQRTKRVEGNGAEVVTGPEHIRMPDEECEISIEGTSIRIVPDGGGGGGGGGGRGGGGGGGGGGGPTGDGFTGSGCTTCGSAGGGGSAGAGTPSFTFDLGSGPLGDPAGSLQFSTEHIHSRLWNVAGLTWSTGLDVDVVKDSLGWLRQARATEVLADVQTISDSKYEVRFYYASQVQPKAGGLYPLTGSPFVTWTVENPNPGTTNRVRVTESRLGGGTWAWNYEYTPATKTWKLTAPGGLYEVTTQVVDDLGAGTREYITEHREPGGAAVQRETRKYLTSGAQEVLVETSSGTGAARKVTSYAYGSYTTRLGLMRLPTEVVHPDGSWERSYYDANGRLLRRVIGRGNRDRTTPEGENRETVYDYSAAQLAGAGDDQTFVSGTTFQATEPYSPRLVIEKVNGVEVSRRYRVHKTGGERRAIVCPNPGAAWNDAANEVTVTKHYPETDPDNPHRIHYILHPDSTCTLFGYVETATQRTVVVSRGQPNSTSSPTSILNGTRETTVTGATGQPLSRTVERLSSTTGNGTVLSSETWSNHDALGRPGRLTTLDGRWLDYGYACCGLETVTDKDGVVTTRLYDAAKRFNGTSRLGIAENAVLDAAGRVKARTRQGTSGPPIVLGGTLYDTAGRTLQQTNALGGVSVVSETFNGSAQLVVTTTAPDLGTRIETYFRDGRLDRVTGTASIPVRYEYDLEQDGGVWREYTREIRLTAAGADTTEWTKSYQDGAGRTYKTLFAKASAPYPAQQSFYNNKAQLWKESDPDGVTTLHQYNAEGDLEYTATDLDQDGVLDLTGPDRVTRVLRDVTTYSGSNVRRTRTYRLGTIGSATETLVRTDYASTDGLKRWTLVAGQNNHALSETVYGGGGTRTVTTTQPDGSKVEQIYTNGRLTRTTRKNSANGQVERVDYAYDAHGRLWKATDARNGDTAYAYNAADQVTGLTTPAPGTGQAAQTTVSFYDTLGRLKGTQLPDGATTTNFHFVTGLLQKTSGSRQYPVEYTYDAQGRMKTMKTWQDHAGNAGTAVTTWNYDPHRGWLASKDYPDANTGAAGTVGPDYAYTAGGRLKTRTWARNHSGGSRIVTTYQYGFDDAVANNQHGDLTDVSYNDGTAGHVQTHDRRGRLATTVRGGITTTHAWNDADLPLGESHAGGALNTLAVERAYFAAADTHALKLQTLSVKKGAVVQRSATHAWDTAGRLSGVTADTGASATYGYLPNSPLWQTLTFRQGATTRLTTTRGFDRLNRLQTIASAPSASGAPPVGVGYLYNDANQRVRATDADGSHWVYEYDALGQVKGGKKYSADGTPVAGQQFTYAHDDIGNRTATGAGGNEVGAALRAASYTRNRLNQYTARTVPSAVDVLGVAAAGGAVTVNSQSTYRRGEYFWQELGVANASAPVATSVTVSAGGTPTTGKLVTPPANQVFQHDLDGNLTDDGVWTYAWDAENRLAGMQHKTTLADTAARRKLAFEYDGRGRRIRRQVFPWSGGGYGATATSDQRFVYDGWNLVGVFDGSLNLQTAYVWGLDLSGTAQGAGGVGGLLAAITGTTAQFAAYDGSGNVRALADGGTGAWSAQYEYGPFGELIRATGPQAKANPFRFSTKWHDDESDLLYYGYRYYQPGTGRWPSRDPIGERGGDNLYAFSGNDLLNFVDYLGLKPDCSDCTKPVNALSASPDAPGVRGKDKIAGDKEGNVARLLSHIANQVQKGECVKRLTIVAHGNPDILDIGGSPDSTPPGDPRGRVNRDVSIDERNARRVGERIKNLICFCKPCEVYILSCNVGLGKIAQELANGTGCKVYAPNGYCYPNRKEPDDSKIVPKTRKHPAYPGGGDEFVPFDPQP